MKFWRNIAAPTSTYHELLFSWSSYIHYACAFPIFVIDPQFFEKKTTFCVMTSTTSTRRTVAYIQQIAYVNHGACVNSAWFNSPITIIMILPVASLGASKMSMHCGSWKISIPSEFVIKMIENKCRKEFLYGQFVQKHSLRVHQTPLICQNAPCTRNERNAGYGITTVH